MTKTTNISARSASTKVQEHVVKHDNSTKKSAVNIEALQKELQEKRNLLNLLEKKGIKHQIDVQAIDAALADLDAIIESRGVA